MEEIFKKASNKIIDHFENIRSRPVLPFLHDMEAIQRYLEESYSFKESKSLERVFDDVSEILAKGIVQVTHPRYFGLFNPSVDYAAVLSEMLVASYNPQLAVWSHAPVAQEIEKHVLTYIANAFGYDPQNSFANFTGGGAEANHSAVLCALTNKIEHYDTEGVPSDIKPLIYVSEEAHDSFGKIAHFTGIGRNSIRKVKVNNQLKLDIHNLEYQIKKDIQNGFLPIMIVATLGTTSAGIIDPLDKVADISSRYNTWYHVDAAWGGAAAFSPKLKPLTSGLELADSITCDAHKWFSVPMGSGMYFCRHKEVIRKTFRINTPYMPTAETFDPYLSTMQWSRRLIGLKLFMYLANIGEDGLIQRINHQTEIGNMLRQKLRSEGFKIINKTELPTVCFIHEKIKNETMLDEILNKIYLRKKVWISKVKLANNTIGLRACITSFNTNEEDLNILIEELKLSLYKI